MNKKDLINKIKLLEGLTPEERAELVNLLKTKKKYGLIWEEKPEDVEEQLRTKLPVLREVVEKRILGTNSKKETTSGKVKTADLFPTDKDQENQINQLNNSSDVVEVPNHILIEGDNLHALTALTFTHEDKIDVIYIDPPYNTGNKDFKYNDSYVDKEDGYRHSKWLSFMHKRLEIAKRLLSDKGVIFISIDDYEQATLKLLCDEIFTEMNFVGNVIWQRAYAPINLKKTISQNHDFILIYCKQDFQSLELNKLIRSAEATALYKNPDNDPRGPWQSDNFTVGPVVNEKLYEITTPAGRVVLPPNGRCWLLTKDRYEEFLNQNRIWFGKDGKGVPRIKRFLSEVRDGVIAMSLWTYQEVGHTQDAKRELKEVLHENKNPFETVKPIKLINRIFKLTTDNKRNYTVLDFFAGSGTTLHATMQLNAEDGGNRQCILVTNNENNICEEVTYERNKRVIQGYTNAKGVKVEGLTNNTLRYFRSEYVGRERTHKNKKELVLAATELLCIKEDIYAELDELNGQILDNKIVRCFSDNGKFMLVIYDEETIETLLPLISTINSHKKIKIYIFAPGQYPFTEEFEDMLDKVELCALPDAIYKAYSNVLPKKKAKSLIVASDEESAESETNESDEPNLFTK